MNILIPDSWLREHLDTTATPGDIMRCLSLSGPSVERIIDTKGEPVYDIEITTNRIDAFSVYGIAREAAVILPEYGFPAKLKPLKRSKTASLSNVRQLSIKIKPDDNLVNRILAVEIAGIQNLESPDWLKKRLELVGQRPLNLLIDITNYVMWEIGHPLHIFDLDRMKEKTLIIRKAGKKEKLVTLDNKTHFTKGGEIIFDDGTGEIIDLPGIMGTANTVVTDETKNALLFSENTDSALIRLAAMGLSIRTQAAVINEKHPDPHLSEIAFKRALDLCLKYSSGKQSSKIYDHFVPQKKQPIIRLDHALVEQYLGKKLPSQKIIAVLTALGFSVRSIQNKLTVEYSVSPPTFRNDVSLPVDLIEEIARITGYHQIPAVLPQGTTNAPLADPFLQFENDLKHRLKEYGFIESYTYSMISEKICREYQLNTGQLYKITNVYSSEHVYMRPILMPSLLEVASSALSVRPDCDFFELANIYETQPGNLPLEKPSLVFLLSGDRFRQLRGLIDDLLNGFGLNPHIFLPDDKKSVPIYYEYNKTLGLDIFGFYGYINKGILNFHRISVPIIACELSLEQIFKQKKSSKRYRPIPKFPFAYEDLALIIPSRTYIGPLFSEIKAFHPLITDTELIDIHGNTKTVRVTYQHPDRNLTSGDMRPVREALLRHLKTTYEITLKSS